jgi:hypothetical protein
MSAQREMLWRRLRAAALVEGELPAAGEAGAPWFVRLMLGIAGWIGALFLLGFVGAGFAFVFRNAGAQLVVGAAACAAATLAFRLAPRGDFAAQFAFAVSLAGQALMVSGIVDSLRPHSGAWQGVAFVVAVQQAVLFALVPNFAHRVWTAWSASFAALLALGTGLASFAPALAGAAFVAVWLHEFEYPRQAALMRAAGYGLALTTLLFVVVPHVLFGAWLWGPAFAGAAGRAIDWAAAAAGGLVLLLTVAALLRRQELAPASGAGRGALAGTLILALVSLKAPGIAPAVAVLLVGYANGNRVLAGFGVLTLLAYLAYYYYALHATLLEKAALLGAAGGAVLAARFALQRWWPERPAPGA